MHQNMHLMPHLVTIIGLKRADVAIAGWSEDLLDYKIIGDKSLIKLNYELKCNVIVNEQNVGCGYSAANTNED